VSIALQRRRTIAVVLAALCVAAASAQPDLNKPKRTVIPLVEKGPVLDGKLDDACWKQGSLLTNFTDQERLAKTVTEQTFAWVLRDRDNLYFGFKCLSKDPSKTIAEKTGHDAYRAYKDDVVEIMLDTELTHHDFFHFIINSTGAIWDAEQHRLPETERMIPSPQWNSNAEAKGSRDNQAWHVEVRIPIKDLGEKAVKSIAEAKTWGLQVGRENWSGNEFSTWSRTFMFVEPKDFGEAVFTGAPVREEPVVWKQTPDKSFQLAAPPARHTYEFQKMFVFGPEKDNTGAAITVADPAGAVYVHPGATYAPGAGHGFQGLQDPVARAQTKGGYGRGYSPLAAQFIASRKPAEFLFDLPKGAYRAIFTSGGQASTYYAPTDTRIQINAASLRIENPMPFRVFSSRTAEFTATGTEPVRVTLNTSPGMAWLLNHILIYPLADEPQAAPAFSSFERDFFNYPVEEKIYKNVKIWTEYPLEEESALTPDETKAGFAIANLPAASFTPRNYAPQREDSRGPARAITSPGERAVMQIGFYAAKPVAQLEARLVQPLPEGVTGRLMLTKYGVRNVGRGGLNQWGYEPRTLWPVEPVHNLPAGRTQPYCLLLDVSPGAKPGVQTGAIEFLLNGKPVATRSWRLTVLPFKPQNKRFIWSMFYTPTLATPGYDSFTPEEKAVIQRVERTYLQDLKRHGIDRVATGSFKESYVKDPDGRWRFRPCDLDETYFRIQRECGITEMFTAILGFEAYAVGAFILNEDLKKGGHPPLTSPPERYRCLGKLSPALFDNLALLVKDKIAFYKSHNAPTPPIFLWDEPGDISSPALAPLLDTVHKAGARTHVTLVAGCFPALEGKVDQRDYNGMAMGIAGGGIESPEKLLERKQKDGTTNVIYQNGTIMGSDPRQARVCFGYWAWAWNLDGLNPYKYWKIHGDPLVTAAPFHPLILEDPDHIKVTTLAWEMHSEGVYDNKLVQTLEDLIAASPASPAGAEAAAYLKDLKQKSAVSFPSVSDTLSPLTGAPVVNKNTWPACRYDLLRAQLVRRILQLKAVAAPELMAEVDAVEKDAADREAALRARRQKGLPEARKGNLIASGSCEDIPSGKAPQGFYRWSPQAAIQGEVVHSGKAAIRFAHEKAVPNDSVIFSAVALVPHRTYSFSAWAKRWADGEVSSHSGFWLHTYGPEGRNKPHIRRMLVPFSKARPNFDWAKHELTFTAEPEERAVEIWIYYVDEKSTLCVDDVELLELED